MNARKLGNVSVVVALLVAGLYAFGFIGGRGETHASAVFASTKGLYVGDEVRVLGVPVGRIDRIRPEGTHVRVDFTVKDHQKIPADAHAVIVAPSLVASRFIQLAPVYSSGPELRSGTTIPESRTLVPEEFDDVKQQLTRLADALGPLEAGKQGSLARFVKVANLNLAGGNARRLRETIDSLSQGAEALANGRGDLFATVKNLNVFLANLVANDASVRQFSHEITGVSTTLNEDRASLALALDTLDQAFVTMNEFLKQNSGEVTANVRALAEASSTLASQTKGLAQVLHVAPNAIGNFYNIIDPRYDAFTGTLALGNFDAPPGVIGCSLAAAVLGITPQTTGTSLDQFKKLCRTSIAPFAQLLGLGKSILPNGSLPIPGLNNTPTEENPEPGLGGTLAPGKGLGGLLGMLIPGAGQ